MPLISKTATVDISGSLSYMGIYFDTLYCSGFLQSFSYVITYVLRRLYIPYSQALVLYVLQRHDERLYRLDCCNPELRYSLTNKRLNSLI